MTHHSFSEEEKLILKDIRLLYDHIRHLQSDILYLSMKVGVDLEEGENEQSE